MLQMSEKESLQERSEKFSLSTPMNLSFAPKRHPKKEEVFKLQYFGMAMTIACACYYIYFMFKKVQNMYSDYESLGFFDSFVVVASHFPASLTYTLLSYFFVKAVIVPKYAAGSNISNKMWTLSAAEFYIQAMIWLKVCYISRDVQSILISDQVTVKSFFDDIKLIDFKPLLILLLEKFILHKYSHVCLCGDKEQFSFIKPWVVHEEVNQVDKKV